MKVKVYSRLFREQSEYLYRIAYFYLGEEKTAMEAVQKAACEGYAKIRDLEDGQPFKLQITREMLANSTINQKPNRYLTALYLRHMQKMEIAEIAYAMDIPEGSVKAYLDRAKSEMRQDTAGIGSEVRRVTGIEIPKTLSETVEEGLFLLAGREQDFERRKKWKILISGAVLAVLAGLLILGIYTGLKKSPGDSGNQTAVRMESEKEDPAEDPGF